MKISRLSPVVQRDFEGRRGAERGSLVPVASRDSNIFLQSLRAGPRFSPSLQRGPLEEM